MFITGEYTNIDSLKDSSLVIHYNYKTLVRGYKHYELSNHLGNVLVVISDKRITLCASSVVSGYEADVISASDYYPFGMLMSERSYSSPAYRYGFNGQQKDDEVSGEGNTNTAQFWEYDCRLGRRWNLDPKPQMGLSDFSVMGNNPILVSDLNGDSYIVKSKEKDAKKAEKDKAQYLRMLNRRTGDKYGYKASDELYLIKVGGKNSNKRHSKELSQMVQAAILSPNLITITLVRGSAAATPADDKVVFDDAVTGEVDITDLSKSSRVYQAGQIAHVLAERTNWPGGFNANVNALSYELAADGFEAQFSSAHQKGKEAEGKVVCGMLKIAYQLPVQEFNPQLGEISTGNYYSAAWTDYGKNKKNKIVRYGYHQIWIDDPNNPTSIEKQQTGVVSGGHRWK